MSTVTSPGGKPDPGSSLEEEETTPSSSKDRLMVFVCGEQATGPLSRLGSQLGVRCLTIDIEAASLSCWTPMQKQKLIDSLVSFATREDAASGT